MSDFKVQEETQEEWDDEFGIVEYYNPFTQDHYYFDPSADSNSNSVTDAPKNTYVDDDPLPF